MVSLLFYSFFSFVFRFFVCFRVFVYVVQGCAAVRREHVITPLYFTSRGNDFYFLPPNKIW